ncbi:MAG TPA: CBS domain-containing protein [Burkholderiaceae bacterium]|nr:CBS domain-containing protein [Burkholderiaceae bacterium]
MRLVADVMTPAPRCLAPDDTVRQAAQAMDELNVGALPVCEGRRVVGILTDRDIALRVMARALPVSTTAVHTVMSRDVLCCYEDVPVEEAAALMRKGRVRRMPVLDRRRRLVGMVSLGDVATKASAALAEHALEEITGPTDADTPSEPVVLPRRRGMRSPGTVLK